VSFERGDYMDFRRTSIVSFGGVIGFVLLSFWLTGADAFGEIRASSTATTLDDARDQVISVCMGTYSTSGSCNRCVVRQVTRLVGDGLITRQEGARLRTSFGRECRAQCIRTSCTVEGQACGSLPDGCGGTLSCGPSCGTKGPNLQICICADGTQVDMCSTVNCDSGPDQDAFCGPVCGAHGGISGTGCIFADPVCPQ
jgi:hypothetical protein